MKPGEPAIHDNEYKRNGTRNLFLSCGPKGGWRHIHVTEQRTMHDFAREMQWLTDGAYPQAEVIRVVLDNLNTHKPASLYQTFAPNAWSSTTPPSTAVGSTWQKSSSPY